MKICHIITRLIIGGAQENTVLSCRGLSERGHDVTLVAGPETGPEGSLWAAAQASGAKLVAIDSMRRAVNPLRDWLAFHALANVLRHLSPDIVHTHSSKAGIVGRAAASHVGVPRIVHTIHGMSFNRTQSWSMRTAYSALEHSVADQTARFVTVAEAMTDQAVAAGLAPRDRFVTIRSGLDVSRFAPNTDDRERVRAEWGIGKDAIVVGTVARLFENKGHEEIIAAMPDVVRQDSRVRFVWVGDGAKRAAYQAAIERVGLLGRVHMTGLVTPDEVPRLINGFDMLVHASRWEGLPRAVVQALLTGVPCVCFDNDGAPEVVLHGKTGVLVPTGDVAGLSHGILQLAADEALRRRMGVEGRALCIREFDWRKMVEELDLLYRDLSCR